MEQPDLHQRLVRAGRLARTGKPATNRHSYTSDRLTCFCFWLAWMHELVAPWGLSLMPTWGVCVCVCCTLVSRNGGAERRHGGDLGGRELRHRAWREGREREDHCLPLACQSDQPQVGLPLACPSIRGGGSWLADRPCRCLPAAGCLSACVSWCGSLGGCGGRLVRPSAAVQVPGAVELRHAQGLPGSDR